MNMGAEPKKMAILGGLALVGGYIFYANVLAGPDVEQPKTNSAARSLRRRCTRGVRARPISAGQGSGSRRGSQEFKPTLKFGRKSARTTRQSIPRCGLDLLAKVQSVKWRADRGACSSSRPRLWRPLPGGHQVAADTPARRDSSGPQPPASAGRAAAPASASADHAEVLRVLHTPGGWAEARLLSRR